jgi:hypothetical protein
MIYLLLIAALLLIYGWSANLWFYKDRHTKPITPNVDNVFDRKALPIYLEYEEVMFTVILPPHTPTIGPLKRFSIKALMSLFPSFLALELSPKSCTTQLLPSGTTT